jgi:hypothetical protein
MLFTVDELASYLGDPGLDQDRAKLVQHLAVGLVYEVVPQATADASMHALAIGLEVAARAIRNAEGYALERIDDYTYQRPQATQTAGVYLTEEERYRLQALVTGRSRVRTIALRSRSVPYVP